MRWPSIWTKQDNNYLTNKIMQDQRYNELQQMLGANAEKGIDERIKGLMQNPTDPRWEDL